MMRPVRLQLSRRKGFSLRALSLATNGLPAINVARPGKWGNPIVVGTVDPRIGDTIDRASAVQRYLAQLMRGVLPYTQDDIVRELRGRNLACWCEIGAPCHADELLELANAPVEIVR